MIKFLLRNFLKGVQDHKREGQAKSQIKKCDIKADFVIKDLRLVKILYNIINEKENFNIQHHCCNCFNYG